MPAPPPTLDRERVEAALPAWVDLEALCHAFGVRELTRWPDHPVLADTLSLLAAVDLRGHYVEGAHSPTRALALACGHLGLSPVAVRRRLMRARSDYLKAREKPVTKCHPREATKHVG